MNACICDIRAAIIRPNKVNVKESKSSSPITVSIRMQSQSTWATPAKTKKMIPWKVATVAPPRHFPMTIADRRDQHLAKEAELPVPDNGADRENGRGQHGHYRSAWNRRFCSPDR
jgi:hypothetical protein